jgi:hypothetical protein
VTRRVRTVTACFALGLTSVMVSAAPASATWSVVGTDASTGQVGAAVASCVDVRDLTSSMALVPRLGAMVSLGSGRPDSAPFAAALLRDGNSAETTIRSLTSATHDAGREARQYGVAATNGGTATHAGADTVDGVSRTSADGSAVVQSSRAGSDVADKAVAAFDGTTGPLSDRLLAALQAGSAAGGDRDCGAAQSAALVVLGPRSAVLVPGNGTAATGAADASTVAGLVTNSSLTPEEVAERAQRLQLAPVPTGDGAPQTYVSLVTAPGSDAVAQLGERLQVIERNRAARAFASAETATEDPASQQFMIMALAAFVLVGVLAAAMVIIGMRKANARLAASGESLDPDAEEDEPRRARADVPKLFDIDASVARRRARALAAARQRADDDERTPTRAGHW